MRQGYPRTQKIYAESRRRPVFCKLHHAGLPGLDPSLPATAFTSAAIAAVGCNPKGRSPHNLHWKRAVPVQSVPERPCELDALWAVVPVNGRKSWSNIASNIATRYNRQAQASEDHVSALDHAGDTLPPLEEQMRISTPVLLRKGYHKEVKKRNSNESASLVQSTQQAGAVRERHAAAAVPVPAIATATARQNGELQGASNNDFDTSFSCPSIAHAHVLLKTYCVCVVLSDTLSCSVDRHLIDRYRCQLGCRCQLACH